MADDEPKTITTVFTNNTNRREGVNTTSGTVFLDPRESRSLTVTEGEMRQLVSNRYLGIEGQERPWKVGNEQSQTLQELNDSMARQSAQLSSEVTALQEQVRDQQSTIDRLDKEITEHISENASLSEDLAKMTTERDQLDAHHAKLTIERDQLKADLEKATAPVEQKQE